MSRLALSGLTDSINTLGSYLTPRSSARKQDATLSTRGPTELMNAAGGGDKSAVAALVNAGANVEDVDRTVCMHRAPTLDQPPSPLILCSRRTHDVDRV